VSNNALPYLRRNLRQSRSDKHKHIAKFVCSVVSINVTLYLASYQFRRVQVAVTWWQPYRQHKQNTLWIIVYVCVCAKVPIFVCVCDIWRT
jgi:hypothetical protein